ncbi:MAG: hypothetical protein ACIARR_09785 [Phycisphaerales bacterium JB059]
MKTLALSKIVSASAVLVASGVAMLFGYQLIRGDIVEDVYKDRLREVSGEFRALRAQYNEAVKRTAITELVVEDGELSVRVRSAAGVERVIETPYDPSGEIYVDYVVLDGRVWMRRVFDARTPPVEGVVIDPALSEIDWTDENAKFGKTVYRSLGEGRWVISVSGDGSLGIGPGGPEPVELGSAPEIGEFEELERDLEDEVTGIGLGEVFKRLVGG